MGKILKILICYKENSNKISEKKIQKYLKAIDTKNNKKLKALCKDNNKKRNKKDIIYEMYNGKKLNCERLQYIIDNCTPFMNISSPLITKLMEDNNKELLEILLKSHYKFYDKKFIIDSIGYRNSKKLVSKTDLYTEINSDKYKISTDLDEYFNRYDSSYYLFNACKSENRAAVDFLLEHMKISSEEERVALSEACGSGVSNLINYLIDHKIKLSKDTIWGVLGNASLFYASEKGMVNAVKSLVELGADVDVLNKNYETPLFKACYNGHFTTVKCLTVLGASIDLTDNYDTTPLMIACYDGNINIVKYLVNLGANINKEDGYGWTPLFYACQEGNIDIVKYLVKLGVDINKENNKGETPLSIAIKRGHKDVENYLVEINSSKA